MSVATRFKYHRPFPFCPASGSPGATWDYVGGLTLTDAMAFWWNIEDLTISTTGTSDDGVHFADAGGSLKFNPPTTTDNYTNNQNWIFVDCALLFSSLAVPLASLPSATRTPVQRVCVNNNLVLTAVTSSSGSEDTYKVHLFQWEMELRIDPGDSSKYAIYYRFVIRAGDFNNANVAFCNPSRGSQSSSGAYVTGTFTISGLTFNWRCYYNLSISGYSMSVSQTDYTYP